MYKNILLNHNINGELNDRKNNEQKFNRSK